MRTRLLVSMAALAAILLLPSGAFATMTAPVVSATTPTAEPALSWADVSDEIGYRVLRGTGACASSPIMTEVGVDLAADTTGFTDTTVTADGAYCYVVEAFDGVTVEDSAPGTDVVVDTVAPAPSLSGVSSGASVRGTLSLSATATDVGGSGVASVAFEYRLGSTGAFTTIGTADTTAPYGPVSLDTSLLADGTYEIHALATDAAGNAAADTATSVVVDNTVPSVTLSGVATGAKVNGSLSLSATASDTGGSGLASVVFEYRLGSSGAFTQIGSVLTTGPFGPVAFNTSSVADGTYQIHALATDGAGNSLADTATSVVIDNTQPTVTLSGVSTNAKVRGTLSLSATALDTGGSGVASVAFEYRLGSSGAFTRIGTADTTAPYGPVSLDTTLLADGSYEIHALATDNAGNALADTATSVLVDNTAPVATLSGVVASSSVRGTLSLTSTASDTGGSGVASVAFGYRLGTSGGFTTIGSADTTAPYGPASFDTTLLADGSYEVQALATDAAGNTFAAAVTSVLIDNTSPAAPATPTGLATVSAAPAITFSAAADPLSGGVHSGVDHYDVYRGATLVQSVLDTGAASYTATDSGLVVPPTPTSYAYTVKAVDKSGNVSAASGALSILVDGSGLSAPTAVTAQTTPTSQRPQISWSAPASAGFTVNHYKVYRGGVFQTDVAGTAYTDNGATSDGTYTYQVVAASAGDAQLGIASAAVAVVYDTTAPSAPGATTASASLDGSVSISWNASSDAGSGIARYAVRRALSGIAPATIADGDSVCQGLVTSCSDTTALNGKAYSYAVFAVDAAGNVSAAGSALSITARDQTPPAAPAGFAATPGDTTVALHWTGPGDDVAGYALVVKPGAVAPASESDGTRICTTIDASSTSCTATGLTNGATYTFGLFALDEALNRSAAATATAVPNGPVSDAKAPGAVTGLTAKIAGHTVTLTWKNPSDKDFDHVEITASERKPSAHKAAKRVYSGRGTKATTTLPAGEARWFVVVAYDKVGNASTPATVHAAVKPASPFGPLPGAKVKGAVHLSWPVVKGAKYYNVQLYAGKKRVLVGWPAGRAMTLKKGKLKRGVKYTWYVWPGLGAKSKAHYGKLIGKNAFTYAG